MVNRLAQIAMIATAGAELIGCGGMGNPETTPRSGETIERTDAGIRIIADKRKSTLKKVTRTINQCGPGNEIKTLVKNRCETDIKISRKGRLHCVSCDYEAEIVE